MLSSNIVNIWNSSAVLEVVSNISLLIPSGIFSSNTAGILLKSNGNICKSRLGIGFDLFIKNSLS